MIEQTDFEDYIFSDGKIISLTCSYADSSIELVLQIRKKVKKKNVPCRVCLRFENVVDFDLVEDFGTAGDYSDAVLVKLHDQFYASFDPFGNSGEPHESDNFVIKAANCTIEEKL